jgi:hypothetical protein
LFDMKILIGTPAYDQQLTSPYVTSVVQLIQDHARRQTGIEFELEIRTSADIAQLRNYFASRVLSDESYSHLLFVDADMGFPVPLIDKLLKRNKPLVAAFCPRKHLDIPRLHRFARRFDNADDALTAATNWIAETDVIAGKAGTAEFDEDGFTRVRVIGAGIMLIERSVLHRMREAYPDLWLKSVPPGYFGTFSGGALLCFAPLRDQTTGLFVTEDVAFCRRWADRCGGEIWACASEAITHLGRFAYKGKLLDKFELDRRERVRPASDPDLRV